MMSLPIIQNLYYINFEFGDHFCHFHRGADLETVRLFYIWQYHILLSQLYSEQASTYNCVGGKYNG
jgi:hypothetical protein